jgi:signal transduction histidine kinase
VSESGNNEQKGKPMPHVLIVDDEKSIRIGFQAFLAAEGYAVAAAADAEEALRLLGDQAFDIVVSDIVLPRTNGIELLQTIRTAAPFAQVIMITGEPTVGTAAEALRAGALDYLTKPVSKNAILRAVGNAARVKALDDERRRLVKENRTYQVNLEGLVEARTAELSKAMEELTDAQSEIVRHERLNALAQLSAGICHDFNNVLVPIRGLTEFMVSHPETLDDREEALRLLGIIYSATDDAKEIVRRMREFYRPRETLEMQTLTIATLLDEVVELTRPRWQTQAQSEGRDIRVLCDAAGVQPIAGNASQLRELLTNLVLNAVDAMPHGGTITLSAKPSGDHLVIAVTDTGDGMPEEVRKRCLEPFFSTKGEHGTGMGLAMVHGIVSRHNGIIEIDSELSKGTRIRVNLPLSGQVSETITPVASAPSSAARPLRVLVVDDEEWSRMLTARYLMEAGHTVIVADSGAAAIAEVAGAMFDVVVTDLAMPGINGDQVAAAVKEKATQTPVLLLTGDPVRAGKVSSSLIDAVLEKPATQREVVRMVEALAAGTAGGNDA